MLTYVTDKLYTMVNYPDWTPLYEISKKVETMEEAIHALEISNGWNLALIPLELYKEDINGYLLKYTTIHRVQSAMGHYPQLKKVLPQQWEIIIRRHDLTASGRERKIDKVTVSPENLTDIIQREV